MKTLSAYLFVSLGVVACADVAAEGSSTTGNEPETTGISMSGGATLTTTSASTSMSTSDPSTSSATTESSTSEPTGDETTAGDASSSDETTAEEESSGTAGEEGDTIYAIQDGTIAQDTEVDVRGVVITGMYDQIGMFVQEPAGGEYSGVYVDTGVTDLTGFAIGDAVDITGVTTEGNGSLAGLTAIDASAGTITAAGGGMALVAAVVPLADLAAPATAEPWEGVLVMVDEGSNVVVSGDNTFGEFFIESGGDEVLVDDFLYDVFEESATFPNFGAGAEFESVTGPLNFTYDEFKIAPRSEGDLPGYMQP
jgi:hypothetical protein